jgi:hypothetical protein
VLTTTFGTIPAAVKRLAGWLSTAGFDHADPE